MKEKGFTLIEVLIAIVLISIAASLLLTVNQTGLLTSGDPLNTMADTLAARQGIERVNADYRSRLESDPNTDISIYDKADLSSVVPSLAPGLVRGDLTSFSAPDAQRKVKELASPGSRYVRITATRGNSTIITLLGN